MHGAGRKEVQTHAAVSKAQRGGIHAVPAQLARACMADRLVRQCADHHAVMAKNGQRCGNVGFRAAEAGLEARRLQQQFLPRRR